MLLELENKVANYLSSIEFPLSEDKILLAVSGGADSIALLYIIHALKTHNIFLHKLHCVHINHKLRGLLADKDEEFVASQARQLNISITTRSINVREFSHNNRISIETAARQMRIQNLIDIAQTNNCSYIATGHQKNDNAETIIHRMLRGTGYRGLAGIWPIKRFAKNIVFFRPLLCVTRQEIIHYLQQKNLTWRQDHTNKDCKYTRNYIRHKLLPLLQKENTGSLAEQLSDLSTKAGRFHRQICSKAESLWEKVARESNNTIHLNLQMLKSQPLPVKIELIRKALNNIGCGEKDLTSRHYEEILKLTASNSLRNSFQLPDGFLVHIEKENLVFTNTNVKSEPAKLLRLSENVPVNLAIPGRKVFDKYEIESSILEMNSIEFEKFKATKTLSIECFDFDKIRQPLTIRFRQAGDRFVPLGQKSEKKVGKFLTAQHISNKIRNKVLVISDIDKIVWLWPARISELSKVEEKTRKILKIKISEIQSA